MDFFSHFSFRSFSKFSGFGRFKRSRHKNFFKLHLLSKIFKIICQSSSKFCVLRSSLQFQEKIKLVEIWEVQRSFPAPVAGYSEPIFSQLSTLHIVRSILVFSIFGILSNIGLIFLQICQFYQKNSNDIFQNMPMVQ